MNTTKLLEFYINMGFKLLPVKKNKEPLVPGFTDPSYKGLSIKDAEKRIKNDEWIAGLMPKDIIAIDIDTEENKKLAIFIFCVSFNGLKNDGNGLISCCKSSHFFICRRL